MLVFPTQLGANQLRCAGRVTDVQFTNDLARDLGPLLSRAVIEMKFTELNPALSEQSLQAVADFGFIHMTPVQASSIPQFLKNKVGILQPLCNFFCDC
jgi:hypothetical protein